jgi:predicted pyridoxine 5'-phosphate oxidase superfamily flavin-nucleotide-binding protein
VAVDVYHEGERVAQRRAGVLDQGASSARAVRSEIPEVAQKFLLQQPMVVLGAADTAGQIWATLLSGRPGFLHAEDAGTVTIDAQTGPDDPLHDRLTTPAQVGMLAIAPSRHRRMRMNGRAVPTSHGLHVKLDQVYSNCPKYIQKREHRWEPDTTPGPPKRSEALTTDQQRWITSADTFFIATSDREGNTDASHRGGNPGFIEVVSQTVLRWPDYVGNAMFNTLGNLEVNPRAGLLLPDWHTGALLHLTGTARTDWPTAERLVEFTITDTIEIPTATPLRWTTPTPSRFNPPVHPPENAA